MKFTRIYNSLQERINDLINLYLPSVQVVRGDDYLTFTQGNYIRNGLVFNLDGICKGPINTEWRDLKGNVIFTNNGGTSMENCWDVPAAGTLQNTINTFDFNHLTHTIEVVYETTNNSGVIFSPKTTNNIAFGLYNNRQYLIATTTSKCVMQINTTTLATNGKHVVSVNMDGGVFDMYNENGSTISPLKQISPLTSSNCWNPGTYNGIGGRSQGTYSFTGKIYAIRIYNRKLTQAEMIHNQKEDAKRFGLT